MTNVCIIATIVIYLVGMLLVGFAIQQVQRGQHRLSTSAAARWARWSLL